MAERTQQEIAEDWLKYAIKGWKAEIKRLRAVDSSTLLNSFKGSVIGRAQNSLQVQIAYAWYGQMVDAGLGRGVAYGDRKENTTERKLLGGKGRRAKPFWSKGKNGIGYQTYRLGVLLGHSVSTEYIEKLADSIDLNHVINYR